MSDTTAKTYDPHAEMVRISHAHKVIGTGRSYLYKLQARDPEFPTPIRLSKRVVMFRQDELRAYARRLAERAARGELPEMSDDAA